MAIKQRGKRFMTDQEKRLRKMLIDHRVSLQEIADREDISVSAVSLRLKSLTPEMVDRLEGIILELSKERSPQKAAS